MSIKFYSTVLMVNNLTIMKSFYKDVLQQSVEFDFGTCINFKCGLSLWQIQHDHHVAKLRNYTFSNDGNKNIEVCFETENFESDIKKLQHEAITFLHHTVEEPWGQKTIRFYDPEQNLVELGESIACFVKRLLQEGFTAEQVSEKTSVPLQFVQSCQTS